MGSTRFPKKILKAIRGKSLLGLHLERILKSKRITKLKVATTEEKGSEQILEIAGQHGVECHQGDTHNVLDRFYRTVEQEEADYIVRLTSDCPLIDAALIDQIIDFTIEKKLDYGSNTLEEVFPDGQDVEVFKYSALKTAWENAELSSEKEHVTPYIHKNSSFRGGSQFLSAAFPCKNNYSHVRLTVDEPVDLEVIESLVDDLGFNATWQEYTARYLKTDIQKLNQGIIRNEGYQKSLKND